MGAYTISFVPKLKRITESIHGNDSIAFMQLVHAGGKALRTENKTVPMAPSEKDYIGSISREMTEDDIETTIRNFEAAANIAKLAKFDGVEIHGAITILFFIVRLPMFPGSEIFIFPNYFTIDKSINFHPFTSL